MTSSIAAIGGNESKNPSLHQMLQLFSETERLKPEESWYRLFSGYQLSIPRYCNKCKLHVEATKQLTLYRLPPLLIVQLKRFVYTTGNQHSFGIHRRSKDERAVNYPIKYLNRFI